MIVIPMAGLSSRFFKVGYKLPKYMLNIKAESIFSLSVKSFEAYFESEYFVFICRDVYDTPSFIKNELDKIGVKNYKIKILNQETMGQAETVVLGLEDYEEIEDLTIFNIDTFRPGFKKPFLSKDSAGYLETFIGKGSNWSNILPCNDNEVLQTAEKQEISEYCCTGLYHFSKLSLLRSAYDAAKGNATLKYNDEFYIAPLYNFLIKNGYKVNYTVIDKKQVIFCGTPDEYLSLL